MTASTPSFRLATISITKRGPRSPEKPDSVLKVSDAIGLDSALAPLNTSD